MNGKDSSGNFSATAHMAVAGAVLALTLTAFCVVAYGVRTASSAAAEAANSLTSKLADQMVFAKAVRTADQTKGERMELLAHVIAKEEGASFIAEIESLGSRAGVSVSITSVGTTPGIGNAPGSLQLTIQFAGGYAACSRFARLVETLPVSKAVSALDFRYDDTVGTWNGTMTLSALSFDTQ